jgi:hypothetical protein
MPLIIRLFSPLIDFLSLPLPLRHSAIDADIYAISYAIADAAFRRLPPLPAIAAIEAAITLSLRQPLRQLASRLSFSSLIKYCITLSLMPPCHIRFYLLLFTAFITHICQTAAIFRISLPLYALHYRCCRRHADFAAARSASEAPFSRYADAAMMISAAATLFRCQITLTPPFSFMLRC